MKKYNLRQETDGSFVLLNAADGTLVGYPTAVVTQSRVYYLTDWDKDQPTRLQDAQIYSGGNGLRAYGSISMASHMALVTSPIRSLSVAGLGGQAFQVQASDVAATTDLILATSNDQKVSILGDYAAQILGDKNAIDAEAERLLALRTQMAERGGPLEVDMSLLRVRDLRI